MSIVEERKNLKVNIENAKLERIKQLQKKYKMKDKEVKRSNRADRRKWLNDQRAAEMGNIFIFTR